MPEPGTKSLPIHFTRKVRVSWKPGMSLKVTVGAWVSIVVWVSPFPPMNSCSFQTASRARILK